MGLTTLTLLFNEAYPVRQILSQKKTAKLTLVPMRINTFLPCLSNVMHFNWVL